MPLYDYQCECGNSFEEVRPMAERACAPCAKCGSMAKQVIGAPAVGSFKYGYFEHLGPDGTYARNKEELRSACRRYESYAPGVLDG